MIMLVLAGAAALAANPPSSTYDFSDVSDAEFCAIGKKIIASFSAKLPIQADPITRSDGMTMLCPARVMITNRSILVDLAEMAADWQLVLGTRWSATTCRHLLFNVMAHKGWRFRQNLTFRSGERVVQDADCSAYPVDK